MISKNIPVYFLTTEFNFPSKHFKLCESSNQKKEERKHFKSHTQKPKRREGTHMKFSPKENKKSKPPAISFFQARWVENEIKSNARVLEKKKHVMKKETTLTKTKKNLKKK